MFFIFYFILVEFMASISLLMVDVYIIFKNLRKQKSRMSNTVMVIGRMGIGNVGLLKIRN